MEQAEDGNVPKLFECRPTGEAIKDESLPSSLRCYSLLHTMIVTIRFIILDWKSKLFALQHSCEMISYCQSASTYVYSLCVIDVEEVGVQYRLHKSRDDSYRVPVALGKVAINPIWDVQRSICTESKKIVRRYSFCLARTLEHEELWQYRDRFEPDGEGPQHLSRCVLVREE